MKNRKLSTILSASACAGALAGPAGASPAQAATRCTWGGTPDNPTGTIQWVAPQGSTLTPMPTLPKA